MRAGVPPEMFTAKNSSPPSPQGLPGPPGEKGETGDVGQMVRCFQTSFFITDRHCSKKHVLNLSPLSFRARQAHLDPEVHLDHREQMVHRVLPGE